MSIRSIFIVAEMTFREAIRKRFILFILLVSAFLLLLNISCEAAINVNDDQKDMSRFGAFFFFYMVGLWNLGIAMQITSSLVTEELDNKNYLILLSKPVSKTAYYLGKAIGVLSIIILNTFLVYFIYSSSLFLKNGYWFWDLWKSFLPMFLGYTLLVSIVLFLSLLTNKTASVILSSGLLLVSFIINGIHYESNIDKLFQEAGNTYTASRFFYWILPQFGSVTFFSSSLFEKSVSQVHYLGESSLYQLLVWVVCIWGTLHFYLERREFGE
jgi:ABC-type transport system involved in multi-copper enzyme maturation permease subunit